MVKNYLVLLLLLPLFSWSQGVTVSTTAFTPEQLVKDVLIGSGCTEITNITASAACGIGYFNKNGGSFPFEHGVILRTGQATNTAGTYTGVGSSSVCSSQTDADLQQIMLANGFTAAISDASSIKFNFVAYVDQINFSYIYASQDYGQFQCTHFDGLAIILTDLTSGVSTNLATVPQSNLMVSTRTIRDETYNTGCLSENPWFFGNYNATNPGNSSINLIGNTVPLYATASVIPGNSYSLKFVVGDYLDTVSDSALFLEGMPYGFIPCDDSIQMIAFVDTNNNGVKDTDEVNFKHGTFNHQVNNTGNVIQNTNPSGSVYIGNVVNTDSYDLNLTVNADFASYYSTSTSYNDITIVEGSGINTFYFPVINTQLYSDVAVSVIATNQPQPGFSYNQSIVIANNGTSASSGSVTFTKDPMLTITNVIPTGSVATPTGFTYDYTNLLANETLVIQVTSLVPTIPTVALGDYVTSTATVATAAADTNAGNNSNTVSEIIVGSYDPNDKMESRGAEIPIDTFDSNDYLEYTIRFQNTGTFYATNVRIEDALESQLDWSSFQMVQSSHAYTLTRTNNQLVWNFENIFLPSADEDEAGSNGYIRFKIKPNAGFEIGDIIANQASIYFDFNPPIITNLFESEFTTSLGTPTFTANTLMVYPNPARAATIISSSSGNIESIQITDITGKVIQSIQVNDTSITLNTADFETGIYLLEITNPQQQKVSKKLIIN